MRRILLSLLFGAVALLGVWTSQTLAAERAEKPENEPVLEPLLLGWMRQGEYRSPLVAAVPDFRPSWSAGLEDGKPFLRFGDDDVRLELGGFLQADVHAAEGGARTLTGDRLGSQFLVRRARLSVDGRVYDRIDFHVEGEFTEGVRLTDGYLDLTVVPALRVRGGQFKVPFSQEELASSALLDFAERSLVNALAPARDRGVMLHGDLVGARVSYFLGGFSGTGPVTSGDESGAEFASRVVFVPFRTAESIWLKGLEFAGNLTWGHPGRSTGAAGRTNGRTPHRFRFFAPQTTHGERWRYGGDLGWLIGPAAIKFEYDVQTDERRGLGPGGADLDDVRASGWYVSGTYVLTGEDKQRSGRVAPRRPFLPVPGKVGPGAWEVGVRYAELDFGSDDPVNFFDGSLTGIPAGRSTAPNGAQELTLGVNWYANEHVRVTLNWAHYWYDNRFGTPFSCPSGACTAADLRRAERTSWEILSRLQVEF